MKIELPSWLISILPRKLAISILRGRMIRDFQLLGFDKESATKFVNESIINGK